MAITHYSPIPTEITKPVTYGEASALLARTGHPAGKTTLRSWVREDNITTVRVGKTVYVSWTDILDAHFRRISTRLRASSNWP